MKMKLYSNHAVEKLEDRYKEKGGEVVVLKDGCLLKYGLAIFKGDGLKSAVVRDIYLNSWSSAYSVRFYNELPKKYSIKTK